ncbi:YhgE/Pip family protein [Scopulibacillus cellulosilyticus]|uniref:YhgE/Pip family protein n=1 Tax=Scopulibacillus cellulosilyticus TaxID=2665665 RepID=A0ABW2PWU4_9BACL
MKSIFTIYKSDIKRNITNWAAAMIIIGLIILPSLYAWFNIKASWNPYGNTRGISVAVVNNDEGTSLRGRNINIGNEIVRSLKNNKEIGWTFVSEKQAAKGVEYGTYYASIIIPEDFSKKIATVLTDNPVKPEIIYNVNEKINAVAPKITSTGATGIVEKFSSSFVQTANGAIFQMFNKLGIELEKERPTIENVRNLVFKLQKDFPQLKDAVNTAVKDADISQKLVKQAQNNLPLVAQIAENGQALSASLNGLLDKSETVINNISPYMKQDLGSLQQTASYVEQMSSMIKDSSLDTQTIQTALDETLQRLNTGLSLADGTLQLFDRLNGLNGNHRFAPEIAGIQQIKNRIGEQQIIVNEIKGIENNGGSPSQNILNRLNTQAKDTANLLNGLLNRFDTDIAPKIQQSYQEAKTSVNNAQTVLINVNNSIPDVRRILNDASKGLVTGKSEILAIQSQLPIVQAKINHLADNIRSFEASANIDDLIKLLRLDYKKESEFFAHPVALKENKIFPIPNYGSAMSPFFTTLSLWVGALLLVSLLTVEIDGEEHPYKSYQIYFGRLFTFMTIGLLQSVAATLGDLYLLHTYVVNKLWFVIFSLLISAVFMLIVYTLVSVFGNIGKALAIVLLVLQISGSGGTFPIQTTPPFFQAISPYLPFTYGISLMREAVGGILWHVVRRDIWMLIVFAAIALIIGLALKKIINKLSVKFVKKVKEGGLIH